MSKTVDVIFSQFKSLNVLGIKLKEWLPASDILIGLIASTVFINILSLIFPLSLLQIYDRIIPYQATSTLLYLIIFVCVAMVIEMLLKLARNYVSAWGDAKLGYKSSCKAFEHLLYARLPEYEKVGSGVHLDRINALNRVKDFYGGQAITTILDLPFVVIFLLLIAFINPLMVMIPLSIQCCVFLISYINGPTLYEALKNKAKTNEKKVNYMVEILTGIHTIKSQGMEQAMLRRFERLQNSSAFDDFDFSQSNATQNRVGSLLSQINLIAIVFLGAILVIYQQMTPGAVAACILLSSRCMMPFIKAMNLWSRFQSIKLAESKNKMILSLPLESKNSDQLLDIQHGKIDFENVSFGYDDSDTNLIHESSFCIEAGESVHLESHGAQGKTTVFLLLKGLLKPKSGRILIDNRPLSDYTEETLGEKISYIPQDGILFQGTILENLTLFRDNEYAKQAKALCKELQLDVIIEKMPQGYHTQLGQGSVDFVSKGIKQRIIIVRSLVDYPKIILFDEANSAMDIASDKTLQEFLAKLHHRATLIMITHRPSLAAISDSKLRLSNHVIARVNS